MCCERRALREAVCNHADPAPSVDLAINSAINLIACAHTTWVIRTLCDGTAVALTPATLPPAFQEERP
jgi:hypothetical protein